MNPVAPSHLKAHNCRVKTRVLRVAFRAHAPRKGGANGSGREGRGVNQVKPLIRSDSFIQGFINLADPRLLQRFFFFCCTHSLSRLGRNDVDRPGGSDT